MELRAALPWRVVWLEAPILREGDLVLGQHPTLRQLAEQWAKEEQKH